MFEYIRTHFTLALTTVKAAIVSTTVSPLKEKDKIFQIVVNGWSRYMY